ncbi:AAA family ATPase [Nocardioides sp. CER19]|uniref:AAA family ATPase n=1 Tax=Nocardioides sp. CER19 TaxID=3038538 RepID=UPI00244CEBF9|nr:AAA family ATPase [Nocardioides sp. CER19]MDH2413838.1 AAA family ATPase [Nocardioides sp. CER19]
MVGLVGRDAEVADLTALVDDLHDQGGARGDARLVLGQAGIGKSSVLQAAASYGRDRGLMVLAVAGIESEAAMPYAGLQQLLSPLLEHAESLPTGQRRALLTAFELEEGPAPQPFLVSLASLGLLTEAAAERPVLIIVDDAHWLDQPSHDALAFIARRLEREPILLLAAIRSGHDGPLLASGTPTVELLGLADDDARTMLEQHAADLDGADRTRILAEACGNPLALVELPIAWRAHGGSDTAVPLTARLERAFAARLTDLPPQTRAAALVAAVNDEGDLAEIIAAAEVLIGHPVGVDALEAAAAAGLLSYDHTRVRFRHPLVRSGVLAAEPMSRRHEAHAATAAALIDQPYRQTWHRAQAIVGIDDDVADALEGNHVIALRRGSVTSAIWALERAAQLTSGSALRGRRLLMAAEHAFGLGRADLVDRLVTAAEREELTALDIDRLEWLREIFNDGVPGDAHRVRELSDIAWRTVQAGDLDLALNLLLGAALRCWWADAGSAARASVATTAERIAGTQSADFELDPRYLAAIAVAEPVACAPRVCQLLNRVVLETVTDPDALRLYAMAAHAVGQAVHAVDFGGRAEAKLREQGRLGLLSHVLTMQILDRLELGDWEKATACVEEGKQVAADSGQPIWNTGTLALSAILAAAKGQNDEALELAARAEQLANGRRLNDLLACVQLARGYAMVATGRYAEGFTELRRVFDSTHTSFHLTERYHGIAQLAEAAAHTGQQQEATQILDALERETTGNPASVLRVQLAYARAVLAEDAQSEAAFSEALSQDLVRWPWPKARLELAYGSWLRRQRRVMESRQHLRSAETTFRLIGAQTWAEQAAIELRAAGDRSSASGPTARELLSAQELQIARLAAEGLSNREIGERLFLSPRTVGSHLYRIFPKLGIASRSQLSVRLDLA